MQTLSPRVRLACFAAVFRCCAPSLAAHTPLTIAVARDPRHAGWQKICLFACYFQSSPLEVAAEPDGTLAGAARFLRAAFPPEVPPAVRALGWKGFIAWRWRPTWPSAFEALRNGGKPIVPPILQEVVLSREPAVVYRFAERVAADFDFDQLVPAHFDAPLAVGPREWLDAFRVFGPGAGRSALPDADLAFLRTFEQTLVAAGTIRPRP